MATMPKSPLPKFQDTAEAPEAEMLTGRWPDRKSLPDNTPAELVGRLDELLAVLKDQHVPAHSRFPESPTGGTEARIAHLEASAAHLERDVAQMRTDVRDIRERLYRLQERAAILPSEGMIAFSVLAIIAAVVTVAVFQQQLQSLFAAAFGMGAAA